MLDVNVLEVAEKQTYIGYPMWYLEAHRELKSIAIELMICEMKMAWMACQ